MYSFVIYSCWEVVYKLFFSFSFFINHHHHQQHHHQDINIAWICKILTRYLFVNAYQMPMGAHSYSTVFANGWFYQRLQPKKLWCNNSSQTLSKVIENQPQDLSSQGKTKGWGSCTEFLVQLWCYDIHKMLNTAGLPIQNIVSKSSANVHEIHNFLAEFGILIPPQTYKIP